MNKKGRGKLKANALLKIILIALWMITQGAEAALGQYFQQEVHYTIQVTLNDKSHELKAFEAINYINHSPDTLSLLYFHLWPNAYSDNNTQLARQLLRTRGKDKLFDEPELKGSIDSLDFKVNELEVKWHLLPDTPDICIISLNEPLLPGDSIRITTPFRVKIPKGVTSRLGHIGESYQISQWYPKPAVYDLEGWHPMPYLDQGEFYSEYGSYDVSITLPDNYIVGSTGNLQNVKEINTLNRLAADTLWENYSGIQKTSFPPSSSEMKTLQYKEQKIHDFAWFADKRFHVRKGKVILPHSGREITIWAMFTDQEAHLWLNTIFYINNAISYFSRLIGEYPYNNFTAVQSALNAGVGMEYPGITVIGLADNEWSLDEVLTHEIVHTWFYSALGSNERRYPYMDEAITSAYTERYMTERYPGKKLWEVYLKSRKQAKFFHVEDMPVQRMQELEWLLSARTNMEQPINLPAPQYSTMNYGIILYNKAATGFGYLREYLGDSVFDSAIKDYYHTLKFRHPQPNDLREAFEMNTSKDLKWFFDDFIGTTKRLDYKIVKLEDQRLLVKNKGEMVSPLVIAGIRDDSILFEQWIEGFEEKKWIELPKGDYSEIKIDPGHVMPELFRLNNNVAKEKLFPKADPYNAQLLFTFDNPDKRTLMYIPAINWNTENGFMAGIAFHNGFLISKPFEYLIMPFYSFSKSNIAGFGKIALNITPFEHFIRMATLSLEATKFGAPGHQDYHRIKTGLDLHFRKENINNPLQHKAMGYYIAASDLLQIELMQKARMNSYLQFGYQLEKNALINPFKLVASLEANGSYQKSSVEINYQYSYHGKKQGFDFRLFAGTMLKNTAVDFYSFAPGGRSGRELYLFEGTYPNRFTQSSTSFWSRQMTLSEGGIVSPVNDRFGFSKWLVSATFTSNLPGKVGRLAIKPFLTLLLNDRGLDTNNPSPFFWETGLKTGIWNIFEIYVPLLVSPNIESIGRSFKDRIRFVFQLNSFNQINLRQGVSN
ncbi:MAG TPA: M1 family metallopeptidase [Prolixibacteraceae bacterium]|nr:M1 family metallopeptidase [Prolixibacteraceae bacterium]